MHFYLGDFCAPRIFVLATGQNFSKSWRVSGRKEDHTLSMLENVQSQDRAHRSEQQDMSSRVFCWELEFGCRQQQAALMVLTLLGAGTAGAVRELKTCRPKRDSGESKTSVADRRWFRPRECKEMHEGTESEKDPWTRMKHGRQRRSLA